MSVTVTCSEKRPENMPENMLRSRVSVGMVVQYSCPPTFSCTLWSASRYRLAAVLSRKSSSGSGIGMALLPPLPPLPPLPLLELELELVWGGGGGGDSGAAGSIEPVPAPRVSELRCDEGKLELALCNTSHHIIPYTTSHHHIIT
jgi:hypothetical protein